MRPQLGRGVQESDDGEVGSGPVVVISDRLWTNRFGRAADVVGKSILVNATPMTVVGVNPPKFTGAYSAQGTPDIFLPFSMQPIVAPREIGSEKTPLLLQNKTLWWVLVMGRVKPSVSAVTAEAELNVAMNAAVRATMPVTKASVLPRLLLRDGNRGQNPATDGLEKPIYVLMSLSGLVLLLACANTANLLLARVGARQREMSVRLALGAGRWRILRQTMTESLLLSVIGGAAGLLLAWMVRNALPRMLADSWGAARILSEVQLADLCIRGGGVDRNGLRVWAGAGMARHASAGERELEGQRADSDAPAARIGRKSDCGTASGAVNGAGGGSGIICADADAIAR